MPKTTAKSTPAKSGGRTFLQKLNPNSPKKKFLLFIVVFIVIGGGVMAYRSFASTGVGTYWTHQTRQASGSPWVASAKGGVKKDTPVWYMNKEDGVRILDEWRPIIWAPQVRVCAPIFNRERANPVAVDIYPTFNNALKTRTRVSVPGDGAYHQVCSDFVSHTDPNARIGGVVVNKGSGASDQLQLGNISIEAQ